MTTTHNKSFRLTFSAALQNAGELNRHTASKVNMKISSIVKTEISHLLNQTEEKEDVRIFYACESGSRAWGFPSSDSDYDECNRGCPLDTYRKKLLKKEYRIRRLFRAYYINI